LSDPALADGTAIRLEGVTKRYRAADGGVGGIKNLLLHLPRALATRRRAPTFTALDGIDLEIAAGECVGVIGRNGSGKSTTLGLIAGVLEPDEGRVVVRGRVCPMLELGAGFHQDLTGVDNAILNAVLQGLTLAEARARLPAIAEFADLGEFMHRPIRTYSSGMLARLGFAVTTQLDPEILLVDELLAVGDERFQARCFEKIEEFRARGVTIVLVTHILPWVEATCSRAVLIEGGRVVGDGEPAKVIAQYHGLVANTSS